MSQAHAFEIRFFGYAPIPAAGFGDLVVEAGDRVVAEFLGCRETGEILLPGQRAGPRPGERAVEDRNLRILRFVTKNDQIRITENERLARVARARFLDMLAEKGLRHIKILAAHYNLGRERLILQAATTDDADLRNETADLQQQLKVHVDLFKITPRDSAILLGGLGECGRVFCCLTVKNLEASPNARMARPQCANTNPGTINGPCGRVRCCLAYEYGQYQSALEVLPERGALVMTPRGRGRVRDLRLLQESVLVALESGRTVCFHATEISNATQAPPHAAPPPDLVD